MHIGFVNVDSEKMSKSLGNVMSPDEITSQYGADILRIWTASSDVHEDIRVGKEILGSSVDAYRKVRNTMRYLLAALDSFSPDERIDEASMPGLERYILHRLHEVNAKTQEGYTTYNFKASWRATTQSGRAHD